uniref:p0035H10.15 protein n=1 Tax=Oryza sativa subsp. japonica TaxID=39947 RepID=Q9FP28_ORYSJ|nr:P0035H10.15 [Oryza sativa Japonica Group]
MDRRTMRLSLPKRRRMEICVMNGTDLPPPIHQSAGRCILLAAGSRAFGLVASKSDGWRKVAGSVGSDKVRSRATGGRIRWQLGSRAADPVSARGMGGGSGGDGDLGRESGEHGRERYRGPTLHHARSSVSCTRRVTPLRYRALRVRYHHLTTRPVMRQRRSHNSLGLALCERETDLVLVLWSSDTIGPTRQNYLPNCEDGAEVEHDDERPTSGLSPRRSSIA